MCIKCGAEKPQSAYYTKDKTCKECRKVMVRENRAAKLEQYREYDKQRANNPDRVEARRTYALSPAGKTSRAITTQTYREKYPKKYFAHNWINNAIRDGRLAKQTSCECGSDFHVEGHHDDYDKPTEVRWLCAVCHKRWHALHGEALNPI